MQKREKNIPQSYHFIYYLLFKISTVSEVVLTSLKVVVNMDFEIHFEKETTKNYI